MSEWLQTNDKCLYSTKNSISINKDICIFRVILQCSDVIAAGHIWQMVIEINFDLCDVLIGINTVGDFLW